MSKFDDRELLDLMRDQQSKMMEAAAIEKAERPKQLRARLSKLITQVMDAQRAGKSDEVRTMQNEVKNIRNELKKYN